MKYVLTVSDCEEAEFLEMSHIDFKEINVRNIKKHYKYTKNEYR